jgi:ketosteroid isomerase-like protein
MLETIAMLVLAASAGQTPAQDEKVLAKLEEAWNAAHVKGDAAALDRLWSADLVVTVPGMPPMTKEQSLGFWKTGKFKIDRYESSGVKTKVFGDAAISTGRLQRMRTLGDRRLEDDWLFTKVYVRTKEGWQVAAFHASVAPTGKK